MLQCVDPVIPLRPGIVTGEPFSFCFDQIQIGIFQRRQVRCQPITQGTIGKQKLLHEHAQRPGVADNMMQRDQQHMPLLAQPDQPVTQQRLGFQIKRFRIMLAAQPVGCRFRVCLVADILDLQHPVHVRRDPLPTLTIPLGKFHTQDRLPGHHIIHGLFERFRIQLTVQPQHATQVIGRALR